MRDDQALNRSIYGKTSYAPLISLDENAFSLGDKCFFESFGISFSSLWLLLSQARSG